MEIFITEFARQGLGYLISVLLSGVIIWQQRRIDAKDEQITELQDKRILDTNQYTGSYTGTIKEMISSGRDTLNAINLLQRSVDSLANSLSALLERRNT
jgi:hypothetical protein